MNAAGGAVVLSLLPGLNLVGDFVSTLDETVLDRDGFVWSGAIQYYIPDTPHVLTLLVGRMGVGTTMGQSFATSKDTIRIGFEYSTRMDIPFFK